METSPERPSLSGETSAGIPPEQGAAGQSEATILPAYAARLAGLDDGLPLPEIFTWAEPQSIELQLGLEPDDLKTVLIFEQILKDKHKSGKYYQAIKDLAERHASPEIEAMLLTYLSQWLPSEAEQRLAAQMDAHPDWLLLRCLWGTRVLMNTPPEQIPLALVAVLERLGDKLELHQHLSDAGRAALTADLVNAFYYTTALFFMQADQPERALYSLNLLARSGSSAAALTLLQVLLRRLEASGRRGRLDTFVEALSLAS